MICPKCNTDNEPDANFCENCGRKFNNGSYFSIREKIREKSLNPYDIYNYEEILDKVKEIYINEQILNIAWGFTADFLPNDDACLHYIAEWISKHFQYLDEVKSKDIFQLKNELLRENRK